MEVKMCSLGSGASDPWLSADLCPGYLLPFLCTRQTPLGPFILSFCSSSYHQTLLQGFLSLCLCLPSLPAGTEQLLNCSQSHSGFVPFTYAAQFLSSLNISVYLFMLVEILGAQKLQGTGYSREMRKTESVRLTFLSI